MHWRVTPVHWRVNVAQAPTRSPSHSGRRGWQPEARKPIRIVSSGGSGCHCRRDCQRTVPVTRPGPCQLPVYAQADWQVKVLSDPWKENLKYSTRSCASQEEKTRLTAPGRGRNRNADEILVAGGKCFAPEGSSEAQHVPPENKPHRYVPENSTILRPAYAALPPKCTLPRSWCR